MTQATASPPRIALIGVSGYAGAYVERILKAQCEGSLQLVAATILPKERNATTAIALQPIASRIYDSYEDMFSAEAGKIDICFIPTGIHWHAPMAIAALSSGANVLVEKPLAGSLADVDRVVAAETRYGKWVAVGFQDMYSSQVLQLKQSIQNGIIGKLQSVSMIGAWPRHENYYQRNLWAGKLSLDGTSVKDSPLNNAFSHFVNLSLYLAGDELHASANATVAQKELYRAHDIESFDTAVLQATAENGVSFWFGVTHASVETIEPRILLVGERGTIEWEHEKDCTIHSQNLAPESFRLPGFSQARENMFENVLARLAQPNAQICDSSIAKSHAAFIESVHQDAVISSVHPDLIEYTTIGPENHRIPAIKGITQLLERAFDSNGSLGNLSATPIQTER